MYTNNLTPPVSCAHLIFVRDVPYVSEEAAGFAREIERRFQSLPTMAGVVFVSVDALAAPGGKNVGFRVRLGISKKLTEDVGWALIQQVLKDEIASKVVDIQASVFTGFAGACRDQGFEDADSATKSAYDRV
jgi:hypothetical protein